MAIALQAFFPKIFHRNMQKIQHLLSHQKIQQKSVQLLRAVIPILVIISVVVFFFCFVISHMFDRSLGMFWHLLGHNQKT